MKEKKAKDKKKKIIQRPLKVECFYTPPLNNKCAKIFEIKYNRSRGEYTQRNIWGYWTEKEEDKKKYICNDCLVSFYKNDKHIFWEKVTSEKKRNILRTYVNGNSLRNKRKIMKCDEKGCETACCYGCQCCEEKINIINELTKQLKKLRKLNKKVK